MSKRRELPIKEAVALHYKSNIHDAPIVVAKGKGIIAENILSIGSENDIPIQQDPTLVELLGQLNINETIPEDLYNAVAEIFAFVYQLDKRKGKVRL
ncbi:EscU/YscU/HrcU family type III secretion system export apparatus switch protein [Lederbergia wuyishanensis]|uniref:Flagellar biosynthesis protein n=1 Tax=Lederbergia wuyishanensis TaxID=1347903 RepID=A0ABU0CZP1_9BACI|nr:EscU/YscU/HrcU family type III secretion system export apparatus switch protein [Lederbergia wuyishanensis]MCJ8006249.1 EscU/YscU/HrcU family type III secretion system export apparatus switch protein [Lederbergia wuyishanensis]MDQ0341618.1 flagellar biosynthesis protein [Lederbergia wuyishanensis]